MASLRVPIRFVIEALLLSSLLAPASCKRQRFPSRGDAASVVVVAQRRDAASPPRVSEQEPNDTLEQSQLLGAGGELPSASVEGILAVGADGKLKDVDVYKLIVPGVQQEPAKPTTPVDGGAKVEDWRFRARRLAVELVVVEGAGLALQVLDGAGKTMEAISLDAGSAGGMPNLAVSPGTTYFIRVKPQAKSTKAKAAESQSLPSRYRLTAQLGEFELADEREPNGAMETAIAVSVLGTAELAGYHGWPRDQDFYRLVLPEVTSSLDVEIEAVDDVGASLLVLDGAGSRLGSAKGRRNERLLLRNVTLQPFATDAPPAARNFFVVVRAETGQNRDQRYVLRLTLGTPRLDAEVEPNDRAASATPVRDGNYSGYLPPGDVDFYRYDGDGQRDVTFEVSFPARVRGKLESSRSDGLPTGTAETKKPRQTIGLSGIATQGQPLLLRVSGLKGDGNANDPYRIRISSAPTSAEKPPAPTQ